MCFLMLHAPGITEHVTPSHPLPCFVEFLFMPFQQNLNRTPYWSCCFCFSAGTFIPGTLHCNFSCLHPPPPHPPHSKATPHPPQQSKACFLFLGFLTPVPMSEYFLQAISQDLRAYLICSLVSRIMVFDECGPKPKNSCAIYFVQFYCRRLNLVMVTPPRLKAEFLMPFWWQILNILFHSASLLCSVWVLPSWSNLCHFNSLTKWSNLSRFSNLKNCSLPLVTLPDLANSNRGHTAKHEFQIKIKNNFCTGMSQFGTSFEIPPPQIMCYYSEIQIWLSVQYFIWQAYLLSIFV